MEEMQKALIYCRVSSERQKNEGQGLESQEYRCRVYAQQKGYEVEKVFYDSFTGGGDFMKRPAMRELLGHSDENAHKEYVVIFDDLKRFARDTHFHWNLRREFKARGLTPECLNFNFDDTPEGEFVETILAAQGELERKQNCRQVIQKQKARLEKGYWPFYPPPGYKAKRDPIHGKLLHPEEPKAKIIKEALEGFASGRFYSQVNVQNFLQSKNFCDGKRVHLENVKRLLTRAIYAGYIEYEPWEVSRRKGYHEPLISLEAFERIQDKLNGKARVRSRKDMRADFPLRQTNVVCSSCSKPYTASYSTKPKTGYRIPYYRCNAPGCSEKNRSIPKKVLEPKFEALLQEIRPKTSVLKLTKAILLDLWQKKFRELEDEGKRDAAQLAKIGEEIQLLVSRAKKASNEKVVVAYEKEIGELTDKKEVLQGKINNPKLHQVSLETALERVFKVLENPYLEWKNGDLGWRRLLLTLVFEGTLPYSRKNGFETPKLSLPLRAFEHFVPTMPQDVETPGIGPGCEFVIRKPLQA